MSALGGGGLEVNMFEQVCSDGHRMSLAGRVQSGPMSAGGVGEWVGAWGAQYSEVQCIIGNGVTWDIL